MGLDRIVLHATSIFLTNLEGNSPEHPAYQRLIEFFRQIKALGKKLEFTDINLQAGPEGLQSVQASLVIWTQLPDDPSASR
jgi:hypothetical protein